MSDKRFEEYDSTPSLKATENCSTCEHYYTGACDGLSGYCKSYKAYRSKTIEDLVTVSIGTTVIFGVITIALLIVNLFV